MHIPDGYLSPETCGVLYASSASFWYVAAQRVKRTLNTRFLPLISVFSAFSFVVMMFNLPLPGGTTGHAVGMGISAIVLGPWASILAISTALAIQALFFGDGGITALGANCFNMAIVGSLVAYGCYRVLSVGASLDSRRRVIAAGLAGYAAINIAALCAAVEFGLQPALFHDAHGAPLYCPYGLAISVPAMAIGHLSFAGLAELVITAGLVAYLQSADPSLLRLAANPEGAIHEPLRSTSKRSLRNLWAGVCALLILTPLGIIAVGAAWGEWMPEDFAQASTRSQIAKASRNQLPPEHAPRGMARLASVWNAPVARYAPRNVSNPSAGYLVSAALGVVLIAALLFFLRVLVFGRNQKGFIERSLRNVIELTGQAMFAEQIARLPGFLQRMQPRVKLAGILSFIVAAVSVHQVPVLAALLLVAVTLAAISRVPLKILLSTVWAPAFLFSGLIAVPALFLTPGVPAGKIPVLGWTVTLEGLSAAVLLLLRVETGATFAALLVLTTEWARVLRALRFFRVPGIAVVILGMTHRYLFLLLKTAGEMLESRASRQVGNLAPADRRRFAAATVGVLFGKSYELSTEVHLAMRSRGFDGEVQLLDDPALGRGEGLQLALVFSAAVALIVLGH